MLSVMCENYRSRQHVKGPHNWKMKFNKTVVLLADTRQMKKYAMINLILFDAALFRKYGGQNNGVLACTIHNCILK